MKNINLATKLTLARILLIPFFMIFMFVDNLYTRIFALVIFVIAGLADLYDGIVARHFNVVTKFGTFLDPLADKLLISAAFISFVELKELNVPAWMVIVVIAREFLITGLRLVASTHGRIIPADVIGKVKTLSQFIGIIVMLCILILNSVIKKFHILLLPILHLFLSRIPYFIMIYITFLTVYSGVLYVYRHRDILQMAINE
ncbi:MAG: CDP-diacylglycerol--glycerol-3-phosphate 3-phosphatidyltransferase [Elusimicrobiota bacterium]|nr:CDP-diacylglycerol--glycerol-3-phosphate 3-phosphatidyltransferase [Elusimicrobiota bacterium]